MIGKKGKLRQIVFGILSGLLLVIVLAALGVQGVKAVPDFLTYVDDGGADDYPGQKDINFLQRGYDTEFPDNLYINWGLDDTDWSGQNTGDVCVLFDSNDNGMADYSFCITVNGTPAALTVKQLYSCGDSAADKCTNPRAPILFESTGVVSIAEVDPFGTFGGPYYDPLHVTGNTCSFNYDPFNCYTYDTFVETTISGVDLAAMGNPEMINVCSYPSAIPGSAPSDCVFLPGAGFLEIVKVADPDVATNFVFNMGAGQASAGGVSSWTISGSGIESYISFMPGTGYDLSEIVPDSWVLTNASCVLNDGTSTGTWTGSTITDFAIQTGLMTTCTFTNAAAVDVTVTKTDYDYARTAPYPRYPYIGSALPYKITVANEDMPGDIPAQGVIVTDKLDANVYYDQACPPEICLPLTITSPTDFDGLSRSCAYDGGSNVITCDLGSMAPGEVVTIDFAVIVGPMAPTYYLVEIGECTQGTPNLQDEVIPVDVCNEVSVSATNEVEPYTLDNSDSEPTDLGVPTAVDLLSFTATGVAGGIRLDWETEMETDNLGFNLYRAPSLHAPRTKINEELIPGNTGGMGAAYFYIDEVNSRNVFYYWIESVDIHNFAELHEDFASARALKKIK